MTLAELKAKYGIERAKYEPKHDCKFCNGTGERVTKHGLQTFCICLFVAHEASDFVADGLAETARRVLRELRNEGD